MLNQNFFDGFNDLVKLNPQIINLLRDFDKSSLLMSAVKNGNRDVFMKLLDYPQDISIVCDEHMNVFHYIACYQDDTW